LPWLDNWIVAAQHELGHRTNEDEAFEAARLEAERRFRAGLENPSSALMEEFAREEQAEADRQLERKRRRVRILEQAIRLDELALDATPAAVKFRIMAEIEGRSGWKEIGEFLFAKAGQFFERGDQKGENSALFVSIATYNAALEEYTRERAPLDWAKTQNNLGLALWRVGERESGTARLEEAVASFRVALQEQTRERVPLDWAMTQNGLGLVLWRLGERESGTARLEEAVAAYRAALEEYTRERTPLDWAQTQNNLGVALLRLGERESGTARLEEAVAAYRAALSEGMHARAGSASMGGDTEQSRPHAFAAWRAGEGDGEARGGGGGLSRGAGGMHARAGSAPMGDDAEQSRQCPLELWRAGKRDGAA
jgi:tetratricopeptide (TPR) repeat protein